MIVLGIDPGVRYYGWALLGIDSLRLGCDTLSESLCVPTEERPDLVVIELPQVYGRGRARLSDIRNLTESAGRLHAMCLHTWPGVRVERPTPAQWKGQVPKDIHQSRIKTALGAHWSSAVQGLSKTAQGHSCDAAGLALWGRSNKLK